MPNDGTCIDPEVEGSTVSLGAKKKAKVIGMKIQGRVRERNQKETGGRATPLAGPSREMAGRSPPGQRGGKEQSGDRW